MLAWDIRTTGYIVKTYCTWPVNCGGIIIASENNTTKEATSISLCP